MANVANKGAMEFLVWKQETYMKLFYILSHSQKKWWHPGNPGQLLESEVKGHGKVIWPGIINTDISSLLFDVER